MTHQPDSAQVSREAVTRTALAVQSELEWVFREQPTDDFGIDAQVEIVRDNVATGRLLAFQIKGGDSFFKNDSGDGWWFRLKPAHYEYWKRHSLPVVVVLYNLRTQKCHWQLVTEDNVERGPQGGLKLLVPKANVLDESAIETLRNASDGSPYALRLRQLGLAKPWMELLGRGKRLIMDVEEWINKSSGRGTIALSIEGNDAAWDKLSEWVVCLGLRPYEEVLPTLFPWANLRVHEETYDAVNEYEQYQIDQSTWVPADGATERFPWNRIPFDEWRSVLRPDHIRPFADGAGEVHFYCLELTLNELGRSFLVVDSFAESDSNFLTPRDD